jgi:hypothetical protein
MEKENRSKHPVDVLRWIETVIDSCKTHQQVLSAYNLTLRCYKNMYLKDVDMYSPLYQEWKRVKWKVIDKMELLENK